MANWCYTRIAIYNKSNTPEGERQLQHLFLNLKRNISIMEGDTEEEKTRHWYGQLLLIHGMTEEEITGRGSCRGNFQGFGWYDKVEGDYDRGYIRIDTETAWEPQAWVIAKMMEWYPALGFCYCAEEPGCGIYINTDTTGRYFTEVGKIDYSAEGFGLGEDEEYFDDRDSWADAIRRHIEQIQFVIESNPGLPRFELELCGGDPEKMAAQINDYFNSLETCDTVPVEFTECWYYAHEFSKEGDE